MQLACQAKLAHLIVPEEGDKFILKSSGKVRDRFIFDLQADFTSWELNKLSKFRQYAESNLSKQEAWLLKELSS